MCGINGIFAYGRRAATVDAGELDRTRDHMAARGPDAKGAWLSDDRLLGLAHRRLSILDLSTAGSQPMLSADGKHAITFNGEIYNFQALRAALEARGHVFRSRSDTEVLLHLYAEKGAAMVHELRGMFAFAIWDADKRTLLLARDPYGIKPLYYADDGSTLRFASQVKALIAGGGVAKEADPAGWAGFYLFGSVPDPFTTYRQIRALPRGALMLVDAKGPGEPQRYHSVSDIYREAERAPARLADEERQQQVRDAVLDSVRQHLVSDVPVGAFLSAGIDSGGLVGLMRDAGQNDIETVTLAFEEYRGSANDEAPLAETVARRYGTRHTTRWVAEGEFHNDLPHIVEAMDQPSIDGINTWFVSKAARERGLKVAISGLGGDELFGGYSSFRDIPRWVRWSQVPSRVPRLGAGVRWAGAKLAARLTPSINAKAAGFLEYGGDYAGAYLLRRAVYMPWELGGLMGLEAAREGLDRLRPLQLIADALPVGSQSAFAKVASLESTLYMGNQLLRDTDWASMAHSLEVRVPLVDGELLRRLAPLMVGRRRPEGKTLLGKSPTLPLPESVLQRPKTGFSMPFEQWIKRSGYFAEWSRSSHRTDASVPWGRRWASEIAWAMA